jgi:hypothetical protein
VDTSDIVLRGSNKIYPWARKEDYITKDKWECKWIVVLFIFKLFGTLLIHIDDSCRTNIDRLVELVCQHRIPYVFDGDMRFPFDADYRDVVVSSTKTKLPCTLQLALENLEMTGTSNLSMRRSSLANCRK